MNSRLAPPTLRSPMLTAALAFAATAICFASSANAQSCQALWVERNSYYKDAGYCFKTARAIRYFGNQGCSYNSEAAVPLSRSARARIAEIKRTERALGCS